MINLTKDADKVLCYVYYSYLDKVELGNSKLSSRYFGMDFINSLEDLSHWHREDLTLTLNELNQKGLIQMNVAGAFNLTESGIIYMENRFKNGLKDVLTYVSLFK